MVIQLDAVSSDTSNWALLLLLCCCVDVLQLFLPPPQVPSDIFICVGFRIKTQFVVSGIAEAQLSVYEPQDKGESGAARHDGNCHYDGVTGPLLIT